MIKNMDHQQKEVNQKMGKTFKFEDRKAREIDKSTLLISHIIGEGIDSFGRRFIQTRWVEEKGEINLGSLIKPNNKIYLIKYIIPLK